MTDSTSTIAGNYPGGIRITCILEEGNPTVSTSSYDPTGQYRTNLTFASELAEGDIVAIANDTDCTYAATGGIPVVETPVDGETLVVGQIVSTPKLQRFPANSAAANSLVKRLAGKYYRTAVVELWCCNKVIEATVMCNGSNACVPGVGATLHYNIKSGSAGHSLCFDSESSGGVGVIPFHYVAAGSDGDTATILCGITGLLDAATGA